jgi:hypothetical protein
VLANPEQSRARLTNEGVDTGKAENDSGDHRSDQADIPSLSPYPIGQKTASEMLVAADQIYASQKNSRGKYRPLDCARLLPKKEKMGMLYGKV